MLQAGSLHAFRGRIPPLLCFFGVLVLVGVIFASRERANNDPLIESIRSFNQELDHTPASNRPALLRILSRRAARLSHLMESNARAAIALRLSRSQVARLSALLPEASSQIEVVGDWQGTVTIMAEDDFAEGTSRAALWMEASGKRVELYLDGSPHGLHSGQLVDVHGIRLGARIAATLTSVTPQAAVSACGPIGEQNIAVLMVEFPGVPFPTSVVTAAELHDIYFSSTQRSLNSYWREASYGKTSANGDVFGPFQLDQNYDYATQLQAGIDAAIRAADSTVDFTVYNRIVVIWPAPGVSGWGGRGSVACSQITSPSKGVFMGSETVMIIGTRQPYDGMVSIAAHEGGHNLGLNHASSEDYSPLALGPPGAPGLFNEYGDTFSVMGKGLGHYSAQHKSQLGWLDAASTVDVETSGTFVLQPFENTSGLRAIRVRRGPGSNEWLWLEYRQPIGYDATSSPQVFSGALIHYEQPALEAEHVLHTLLLDFTPATPHDFSDAALAPGQTWTDLYTPLSIQITSADASGLGVSVAYGPPCAMLDSTSHNYGPGAETGTITLTATSGCTWTATSSVSWITITAGQSGNGSGMVSYALTPNDDLTSRSGVVYVAQQTFTITQATSFTVNYPPTVDSASPVSSTGASQTFTYSFSDPNGADDLAKLAPYFNRSSDGFACLIWVMPATQQVMMRGDNRNVPWAGPATAGTNVALQNSHCGVDVSGVTITASANSIQLKVPVVFLGAGSWVEGATVYDRSGATAAKVFGSWTVPVSSCSYAFAPHSVQLDANQTAGAIAVATDAACPWLASSPSSWITLSSGFSTVGGGTVGYTVDANPTAAPRSDTILIAGQTFSVTQNAFAVQHPSIAANGVVNGASFQAGFSSAAWTTITGTNLAPGTRIWNASDFAGNRLPTQLNGVSVSINGKPGYIYYVSPTQINVLAPDDGVTGSVAVEVDGPNGRSNQVIAQKQPFSPALFLFNSGGGKYVAAVHADGAYVGISGLIPGVTSRPARAGETILLYGTGFGATTPAALTAELISQAAPLKTPVTIRIGGVVANVAFAGLVASGLYQFNVTVPNIAAGDQAVSIQIGGLATQDGAYITVGM